MPVQVGPETAGRFGRTRRSQPAVLLLWVDQSRSRPLTIFENWQAISELNMELAHHLHVMGLLDNTAANCVVSANISSFLVIGHRQQSDPQHIALIRSWRHGWGRAAGFSRGAE